MHTCSTSHLGIPLAYLHVSHDKTVGAAKPAAIPLTAVPSSFASEYTLV